MRKESRLIILSCLLAFSIHLQAATWSQKAILVGGPRADAIGFSIGNKGYIGTGVNSLTFASYKDFWEYDPQTDTWTQKADFGGGFRYGAVGFSIGSKGYVGTGSELGTKQVDFWEYDPQFNTWTQRADFGGVARWLGVGFSIGTKGYIGTGSLNSSLQVLGDFWEWEGDTLSPNYNTWIQKPNFPGVPRYVAIGVSLNNKGYIGTGNYADFWQSDFYEWDPQQNTWTQKADFGGGPRQGPAAFVLNDKVFVGTGDSGVNRKDLWSWDPQTNQWTKELDFAGAPRVFATGLTIGGRGYIGMGFFFTASANDLWEYCDTCQVISAQAELPAQQNWKAWIPVGSRELYLQAAHIALPLEVEVYSISGQKMLSMRLSPSEQQSPLPLHGWSSGIYLVRLQQGSNTAAFKIQYVQP